MSRAMRRATRPPSRSRRTPVKPQKSGAGFQVPWVPIAVVLGIVAVVAVVGYLVIQAGKSPADTHAKEQALEQDPALDLPGEFVDLPNAFADGTNLAHYAQDSSKGPNTNAHVQRNVDYSKETSPSSPNGLPPAGGPHWGNGACGGDPAAAPTYCGPASWGIYRAPWPAETMVHNMEHGGVIVWYNSGDTQLRDKLETVVHDRLDAKKLVVMAPYSDMPADTIALTAWARRWEFPTSQYNEDQIKAFINTFSRRFNPEGI